MKNLKSKIIILMIIGLFAAVGAFGQDAKKEAVQNKYQKVEVVKFDIKDGVEKFTDESLNVMMAEIVEELKKLGKFKEVALEAEKPKDAQTTVEDKTDAPKVESEAIPSESTLRLVGTITEYKEGNRAARYLIGFGAGRAKVKAHIKIVDSGGAVLLERDVDGNVVIGLFGGNGKAITRGLAKEIAKVTRRKFF